MKWAVVHRYGMIQVALVSEQGHIAFIAPRKYESDHAAETVAAHMNAYAPPRGGDGDVREESVPAHG